MLVDLASATMFFLVSPIRALHVCACVCLYACVCVCARVCVYVCIHTHAYLCSIDVSRDTGSCDGGRYGGGVVRNTLIPRETESLNRARRAMEDASGSAHDRRISLL